MEKKNLKVYEAPAVEIVEMETMNSMLAASGPQGPTLGEGGYGEEI